MDISRYLKEKKEIVEKALDSLLPPEHSPPEKLHEAMRYSVFAGGKRLRPIICMASLEALGKDPLPFMPAACALELVHTYSLIHDDLPAMDDDDLRRGKPTSHKVFGEAIAILAGDALLTLAFELIANMDTAPPPIRLEIVRRLAQCGGTGGLVGGQVLDLAAEGKEVSEEMLERIHAQKTAALIEASVLFGALLGDTSVEQRQALSSYGHSMGMAFQITDDILDATGDEKKIGKRTRKDRESQKATYPGCFGIDRARRIAEEYIQKALGALKSFDDKADPLREIARMIPSRER
ncbi:MAG: polyprenyl synthetase family protein [Candidatus Aureabacteria bacterium]|nr:polyprenyl synthetase family protein [Candidatus Auribacterota bacterium]